jgi:hypothetical protein
MITEPDSKRPAAGSAGTVPAPRRAGEDAADRHGRTGDASRAARSWARMMTTGALVMLAAFVTVQVGGCGLKTPLQLPKKAPAPKPAS